MGTAQQALLRARTQLEIAEAEAGRELKAKKQEELRKLRAQGRTLDRQIQAQGSEVRRLHALAEPLWAALPALQREQRQLEEAGPGDFPSDEEITAHADRLKRLEAELQQNTNRRMELSTSIAQAERTLNDLTAQRKLLLWQIEQV
jgi:predicted RNase H-like nuclease (RuvC/YqgF family)